MSKTRLMGPNKKQGFNCFCTISNNSHRWITFHLKMAVIQFPCWSIKASFAFFTLLLSILISKSSAKLSSQTQHTHFSWRWNRIAFVWKFMNWNHLHWGHLLSGQQPVACQSQNLMELNWKGKQDYFDKENYSNKKMIIFLAMVGFSFLMNIWCEPIKQEKFHWQPAGSGFSGLAQEFTRTNRGSRFVMCCTTRWV